MKKLLALMVALTMVFGLAAATLRITRPRGISVICP